MAKKTTALTELTTPAADDLFHIVDDPAGTPASKKITKHNFEKPIVTTEASSATPTIDVDIADIHRITALATNISSMSSGLSGTPYHGQKLIIEFLDDGTGRTISWGASYRATNMPLPTTTTASKLLRAGFMYDSADSVWDCVATSEEA